MPSKCRLSLIKRVPLIEDLEAASEKGPVLIVDDDPATLFLLTAALKAQNIPARTAANGSRAIEMLADEHYRLILLDLLMPVKNGFDVIDYLATHEDATPVIVMTGMQTTVERPFSRNVQALLRKPLDLSQLITLVEAMR
ncbi:MAG: diguanylate cyclase [Acidobacteria bacterium]|nr:diguanylate cyclase [Acidobacteriota bacterium]